jgi:hypothetical protein
MKLQPLFPWQIPGRTGPKPPQRRLFAKFPDGTESEIKKRVHPVSGRGTNYEVVRPDGKTERNSQLRDLKSWLERDIPGVSFETRK